MDKNIVLQIRFPNKVRNEMTFSVEELLSYIRLDVQTLKRYAEDKKINYNIVFEEFTKDLITNYNTYSSVMNNRYIKLMRYTTDAIISDRTIDRLELAKYYITYPEICRAIESRVCKDPIYLGRSDIHISSIDDVDRLEQIKTDFLRGIMEEVVDYA